MNLLLDTHVFLWAITGDPRLSAHHAELFQSEESELHLSVASLWEILIKAGLGRLPLPKPPTEYLVKQMERNRITLLPIRLGHLVQLQSLPPLHRDPFDRMLVAQARAEGMRLLTADEDILRYGGDPIA